MLQSVHSTAGRILKAKDQILVKKEWTANWWNEKDNLWLTLSSNEEGPLAWPLLILVKARSLWLNLNLAGWRTVGESIVRQRWLIGSKLLDSGPVQINKISNVYGSSKWRYCTRKRSKWCSIDCNLGFKALKDPLMFLFMGMHLDTGGCTWSYDERNEHINRLLELKVFRAVCAVDYTNVYCPISLWWTLSHQLINFFTQ